MKNKVEEFIEEYNNKHNDLIGIICSEDIQGGPDTIDIPVEKDNEKGFEYITLNISTIVDHIRSFYKAISNKNR